MNSRLDQGNNRARLVPRFVLFGVVVAIVVAGLGIRLFDLQVARGGYYQGLSAAQQTKTIPVKTSRGLIYDRKGRLVADNVPTFAVKIRPADLPADQRETVTQRLGQILDMPPQQIIETIDSSIGSDFDLVTIKPDVPTETARVVAQDHLDLPGVYVDVEARREYLYGPLLAHILGFEGAISGPQYLELKNQGYQNDDWIGKAGVEQTFESQLRGTYGSEQVEQDAQGRVTRVLQTTKQAEEGDSLELTIDVQTQRIAEKALRWVIKIL